MNPKPQPNRRRYLEVLRKMTPEQRLMKAMELSQLTKESLKTGLRLRFPDLPEDELHTLFLRRLNKCYNKNY